MLAEITVNVPILAILVLKNLVLVFITGLIARTIYRKRELPVRDSQEGTREYFRAEPEPRTNLQRQYDIEKFDRQLSVTVPWPWIDVYKAMKDAKNGLPSEMFHAMVKDRSAIYPMPVVQEEHLLLLAKALAAVDERPGTKEYYLSCLSNINTMARARGR